MAEDEETWGLGRWPKRRRRPPPPDREEFTARLEGDLIAMGVPDNARPREALDRMPSDFNGRMGGDG